MGRVSKVIVDSSYWKSSREGLSVKYTKDMGYYFAQNYWRIWTSVGKVYDFTLFEWSFLLVFVKVESTYWNSSGEIPYVKNIEELQNAVPFVKFIKWAGSFGSAVENVVCFKFWVHIVSGFFGLFGSSVDEFAWL